MPRKGRGVKSVHQRDIEALRRAKVETSDRTKEGSLTPKQNSAKPELPARKPIEFTFNWRDESSSPLVPRLVKEGEAESLRREFINSVAKGLSSPDLDKRALRNPQQFFEDTMDGIHRWHTYGRER